MPVTATHLLTNGDGTDGTSYTTGTFAYDANQLILFSIVNLQVGGAVGTPVLTGGLTFNKVNTTSAGGFLRQTLFSAMSSTPGTTTGTIAYAGNTQLRCSWSINEFGNVDTTGTAGVNAIVQNVAGSTQNGSSITITLAAFSSTDNATYGAISTNDVNAITPGSGFTELGSIIIESSSHMTEWKNINDTTVDATFPAVLDQVGIGVEIKFVAPPVVGFSAYKSLLGVGI